MYIPRDRCPEAGGCPRTGGANITSTTSKRVALTIAWPFMTFASKKSNNPGPDLLQRREAAIK